MGLSPGPVAISSTKERGAGSGGLSLGRALKRDRFIAANIGKQEPGSCADLLGDSPTEHRGLTAQQTGPRLCGNVGLFLFSFTECTNSAQQLYEE